MLVQFEVLLVIWLVRPASLKQNGHEDEDSAVAIGAFEEKPCERCELPLRDPYVFPDLLLQFILVKVENLDPFRGVEVDKVVDAEFLLGLPQLALNLPKGREFQVEELRLIVLQKERLVFEEGLR